MFYSFPKINHIEDVLPAIKDCPEFIVAERENYVVINYLISTPETFPPVNDDYAAIRRECRGIVFSKDGNIIARRLHKFFNVNEREETQTNKIDLSHPHVILEKLDGSMITPIPMGTMHMRWGSKMGITNTSMGAEEFVAKNPNYDKFAWAMYVKNMTPIFEWCSRKNRIVVDYPEDRLVLIAVRDNITGEYASYSEMEKWSRAFNLDLVKQYPGNITSMQHLINETKNMEGAEGWVIRFDNGQMLKIKGDWYLQIHRAKDALNSEKKILQLIFNNQIDDILSILPQEDQAALKKFQIELGFQISISIKSLLVVFKNIFNNVREKVDPKEKRKAFAQLLNSKNTYHGILFNIYDAFSKGEPDSDQEMAVVGKCVFDHIKKHLSTEEKIEKVRPLWGNVRWDGFQK